jgi:hypothetical protein
MAGREFSRLSQELYQKRSSMVDVLFPSLLGSDTVMKACFCKCIWCKCGPEPPVIMHMVFRVQVSHNVQFFLM